MADTVLLLHAFPLSREMWLDQSEVLEGLGKRVVAHDLPGFGGTPGSLTSLSEAAEWVFDRLPPGPLDAVGLSMGGYLLCELLRQAPGRFDRLVFADTSARPDTPGRKAEREEQAGRALVEGVGFLIEAARGHPNPITSERAERMAARASPEGVAGALRMMAARPDSRALLRGLHKPVLALVGAEDTVTPPELARELAELTGGRLTEIAGAGHLSNLDQPEAFNAALRDFLR